MGYSKEIQKKAFDVLEQRRRGAQDTAQEHRQEVYAKIPQVAAIDRQLSSTALSVARAVLDENQNVGELIEGLRQKNLSLQEKRAALLRHAGLPSNYTDVIYTCEKCKDRGYVGSQMCSCLQNLLKKLAHEFLCEQSALGNCSFSTFHLAYFPIST